MSASTDLEKLARQYGRYRVEAYVFVQEGLRHAASSRVQAEGRPRHLTARELVDGVLDLAAERYGLLAQSVLQHWGLHRSEDLGAVTFQLIDCGIFGKRPQDRLEDFADGPPFATVLERCNRARLRLVGS